MNDMQALIDTCESLCKRLDQMASNEKKYSHLLCLELERLNWETLRTSDTLKSIKDSWGL